MQTREKWNVVLIAVGMVFLLMVGAFAGIQAGLSAGRGDLRDARIGGAADAWSVWTECGVGPAECDAALKKVNEDSDGVQYFEDGSAYKREDAAKYLR